MKRVALAAVAVAALAACGPYRFPGEPQPATGTVAGQVLSWPCSPIVQPKNPCAGRPASNTTIVFTGQAGAAYSTTTDFNGRYSLELPAGTYRVSFKPFGRIMHGPATVTVTAGAHIEADYILDSGIRVPVPAPAD